MKFIHWKELKWFEKIAFVFGWLSVLSPIFWLIILLKRYELSSGNYKKFWNPDTFKVVYVFGWIQLVGFIVGFGWGVYDEVTSININEGIIESPITELQNEEVLETTPIASKEPEQIPEILEEESLIFRGNAYYYDLEITSPTKIDYEIESIKNPELFVDTAVGVYIYFLKSEKDFDTAVRLDRTKENFEFYDCTPDGQVKEAKGTCIIESGGLMIGNSQNKDAFVKIKITFYPN